MVIGSEGALVLADWRRSDGHLLAGAAPLSDQVPMAVPALGRGLWVALPAPCGSTAAVNETISSLLLTYIAIAYSTTLSKGPCASCQPQQPSTTPSATSNMLGNFPGLDVHWVLDSASSSALRCTCWFATRLWFALRIVAAMRAPRARWSPVDRLVIARVFWRRRPDSLACGSRCRARQRNAALIAATAMPEFWWRSLRGRIRWQSFRSPYYWAASRERGMLQRRLDLPDATVSSARGYRLPADTRQ